MYDGAECVAAYLWLHHGMRAGWDCAKYHILSFSLYSQVAPKLTWVVVHDSTEEEGWLSPDIFGYAFHRAWLKAKVSLRLVDVRQRLKFYHMG